MLGESHGAHVRLADFAAAPEEAEGLINAWVSDRTEGGMEAAFGPGADFSGILAGGDLWIRNVVHRAVIDVDEDGTEAAGSTGVIVNSTGSGHFPDPAAIVLGRPFFFVRDVPTGALQPGPSCRSSAPPPSSPLV
ncbi:hypothetical protein BE08_33685 [Sorangium cellulosum]|uniref:Serpin domain-containing protein n=1 Tax=Sorangium cellulosum TaxID=56 RepID=A0A150PHZ2_SORCE|nr:hypothetical protein BE08_33685 [Sorangium cellulosum]